MYITKVTKKSPEAVFRGEQRRRLASIGAAAGFVAYEAIHSLARGDGANATLCLAVEIAVMAGGNHMMNKARLLRKASAGVISLDKLQLRK